MVCYYVEKCEKCSKGLKWLCMASVPPERVTSAPFCFGSEEDCSLYMAMVKKHGVRKREDGV